MEPEAVCLDGVVVAVCLGGVSEDVCLDGVVVADNRVFGNNIP